jgi:Holliday junction resolvase RusA-like endonuclease
MMRRVAGHPPVDRPVLRRGQLVERWPTPFVLDREQRSVLLVADVLVPGEPTPKGRPRVDTRSGRVFTPTATKAAERAVAWAFRNAAGPHQPAPAQTFGVAALFSSTRTRGARGTPDGDNCLKLILDALNQGLGWCDDRQVQETSVRMLYGQTAPATRFVVYLLS